MSEIDEIDLTPPEPTYSGPACGRCGGHEDLKEEERKSGTSVWSGLLCLTCRGEWRSADEPTAEE